MAQNIKMTPEMEAALKKLNISDEDIRKMMNPDVRKISLDELDGLSGGAKEAPDDFRFKGQTQYEAGFELQTIVDNFGIGVAINFANEKWCHTTDWERYLYESKDRNAGYYAVFRIWGKIYEGGF